MSSEEKLMFLFMIIYIVFIGIPIGIYLERGRQSGKVGPKLGATLLTTITIGLPWILFCVWSIIECGLVGSVIAHSFIIILFILMWILVYAGPIGAGWYSKWDHYVYPSKKKETDGLSDTPVKGVSNSENNRNSLFRSWRFFTGVMVTGEVIIFLGGGIILSNILLVIIGIGAPQ